MQPWLITTPAFDPVIYATSDATPTTSSATRHEGVGGLASRVVRKGKYIHREVEHWAMMAQWPFAAPSCQIATSSPSYSNNPGRHQSRSRSYSRNISTSATRRTASFVDVSVPWWPSNGTFSSHIRCLLPVGVDGNSAIVAVEQMRLVQCYRSNQPGVVPVSGTPGSVS